MLQSSIWQSFVQQGIDILFPKKCVSCQANGTDFCKSCQELLSYINLPVCQICGSTLTIKPCPVCQNRHLKYLDTLRSVALFVDGPLRVAIHYFKYYNRRSLKKFFASLLVQCYQTHQLQTDIIVPVPLHPSRLKERGYNQSVLLAQEVSLLLQQPLNTKSLIRYRYTQTQTQLNFIQRQENVTDAFQCVDQQLADQSILLIDDVATTGATLEACARVLKQSKVKAIHGLTLAKAVPSFS